MKREQKFRKFNFSLKTFLIGLFAIIIMVIFFSVISSAQNQYAIGQQKVAVLLVGSQERPFQFPFINQDRETIDNEVMKSYFDKVKEYYDKNSYGKLQLQFDIYGPYIVPNNDLLSCDNFLRSDKHGIIDPLLVQDYKAFIYIFPDPVGICPPFESGFADNGIQIREVYMREKWFSVGVTEHEFGHTFISNNNIAEPLPHSNLLKCGTIGIKEDLSECSGREYGDIADVMGGMGQMHFNAIKKESLGWLSENNIKKITTSGTYYLMPLESKTDKVQSLKIPRIINNHITDWYYSEFRDPLKVYGNYLSFNNGVLIHFQDDSTISQFNMIGSLLIDANPQADPIFEDWGVAVNLGNSYYHPVAKVTISTLSWDGPGWGENVKIDFDPQPFIRGDANSDGKVDLADAIFILEFLFRNGKAPVCLKASDVNDDGIIDLSDAIKILMVLFKGESMPQPYPLEGLDSTQDGLTCDPLPLKCPKELVSYLKFDESPQFPNKRVSDSSSNGHHLLTYKNSEAINKATDGIMGSALNFNGKDDFAFGLRRHLFDPKTNSFSISSWIKPNRLQGNQLIISNENGYYNKNGYHLALEDSLVVFKIGDGTNIATISSSINLKEWSNVIAVRNTELKKISLYINGVKMSEVPDTTGEIIGTSNSNLGGFAIVASDGSFDPSSMLYSGSIDETSIWNKVLSDQEILDLYNNGKGKEICN